TATEPQTMASSPGMSTRATSSDQRSPRDKLAASLILSGGIRRGSSSLKPPRNLGVGHMRLHPMRTTPARQPEAVTAGFEGQGTPSVGYSDDGAISSPPAPYHL